MSERDYVPALDRSRLPENGFLRVQVGERALIVGQIEGKLFAYADRCPHAGAALSSGALQGCVIQCPLHGWRFDLLSGLSHPDPDAFMLTSHGVRLDGDQVWVSAEPDPGAQPQ